MTSSSSITEDRGRPQGVNSLRHARELSHEAAVPPVPITEFVWGAGIECSFLPHLNVDQFQWTQHNRFWREDLKLAREELGINYLRYALPWHVLEPEPGKFNWAMADERLAEFHKLGITPLLDVMHFG